MDHDNSMAKAQDQAFGHSTQRIWPFSALCFSAAGQKIKQSQNNSLEAQTSANTDMFCSLFSSCLTQGE